VVKSTLSPKELARAIGVSESSLKRWADRGVIQVNRTAGGHRRISIPEAIRFIRESGADLVDPRILGLAEVAPSADLPARGAESERLFELLQAGNGNGARGMILSLYLSGWSVADICDGPLREALQRVGELWKHDSAGIFIEHRATDICIQAANQLRLLLPPADPGLVAVGGAPAGDPYLLPSLLASAVLAAEGYSATNLGPDTPYESLLLAATENEAKLVWLSLSGDHDLSATREAVLGLGIQLAEGGAHLVVGGRGAKELRLPPQAKILVGASLGELVAFARGIRQGLVTD
jgi:excisionase family DNA binding protein